ncbi:hypothetical protein G3N57_36150, partial [Paraburkholderia sp. Se-20369]|nr:hypothetical protein [Paraburkholderia sp. Se-20369]
MTSNGAGTPLATSTIAQPSPEIRPSGAAQLDRLLERARTAHREGALQLAEQAYAQLLTLAPDHPEALHLLGAVRFQQGQLPEADSLMRRSIERQPAPLALANHAAVLAGLGREAEALVR